MRERPLTERSKARITAGETEGAGTDVCVKCKGAKESGRVNSDRCLACNGRKSGKTKPDGKPEVVQGVSIEVPSDLMGLLTTLADAAGASLRRYASGVIESHLRDQQFPDLPEPEPEPAVTEPTREQWVAVSQWVKDDPTRLVGYTGPTNFKDPGSRAAFYTWALDHGYTPTD